MPTHDVSQNTDITYTPTIAHNSVAGKNNVKLKIVFPGIWSNRLEHKFNKICCRRFERFMNEKILNVLRQENGLVYGGGLTLLGNETFEVRGFETDHHHFISLISLIRLMQASHRAHHAYRRSHQVALHYPALNLRPDSE